MPYKLSSKGLAIFSMEIDREIFPMVILSLPLIQEGQFQFLVKECAQVLAKLLED